MVRKGCFLVAALALLLVAPVAQAAGGWMIGVNGGLGLPIGDFGSNDPNTGLDAGSGPTVGLDICYHITDAIAVGADGGWTQNKHGAEGTTEDLGGGATLTADKDKFISFHFGAHAKYMIPMQGKVHPYGLLGLGIYNLKEDYEYTFDDGAGTITKFTDENENVEQPGSRFGGRLGAGLMYDCTPKIAIGLESDFNHITMDKKKFGVSNLQYATVRAAVSYNIMPMSK